MDNEQQGSFVCYNCNQKNFFDKSQYVKRTDSEMNEGGPRVKEVMIECKSCRESNSVKIEY